MIPLPDLYLASCDIIDFHVDEVALLAARLTTGDDVTTAKQCFEFVRDEIEHSSDYERNPVTCAASEVLRNGTGYCYAKSHLLCALLRANRIAAGLCYQRLSVDGKGAPFCLHGLVAVYLPDSGGWYRIDPRGNRTDINAQFHPPTESLAFQINLPGERDLPEIYASPLPAVVAALRRYRTWDTLLASLPDCTAL